MKHLSARREKVRRAASAHRSAAAESARIPGTEQLWSSACRTPIRDIEPILQNLRRKTFNFISTRSKRFKHTIKCRVRP